MVTHTATLVCLCEPPMARFLWVILHWLWASSVPHAVGPLVSWSRGGTSCVFPWSQDFALLALSELSAGLCSWVLWWVVLRAGCCCCCCCFSLPSLRHANILTEWKLRAHALKTNTSDKDTAQKTRPESELVKNHMGRGQHTDRHTNIATTRPNRTIGPIRWKTILSVIMIIPQWTPPPSFLRTVIACFVFLLMNWIIRYVLKEILVMF